MGLVAGPSAARLAKSASCAAQDDRVWVVGGEAGPCGMTTRKAKANANAGSSLRSEWKCKRGA
jgi:hypothetical protein